MQVHFPCEAWHLAELALLFLTQAGLEMESRGMLALLLLSLYLGPLQGDGLVDLCGFLFNVCIFHLPCRLPMVGYNLGQAIGITAMLAVGMLLAVAAASVAYTVYRFDRMHRTAMELELMAEASYAEAGGGQG